MGFSSWLKDYIAPYAKSSGGSAVLASDGKTVNYYDSKGQSEGSYVYNDPSRASSDFGTSSVDLSSIASLLNQIQSVQANNAYSAALAAARETNSFNSQQAAINREFQQNSAARAMSFEREMAQQSMDFSERMSNTVYQRAVEDLKAAGLSPLLAYSNLQTSSPTGVTAGGHTASGSQASGVKADVSSALGVERQRENQMLSAIALNINSAIALKQLDNQKTSVYSGAINDLFGSVLGLVKIASKI